MAEQPFNAVPGGAQLWRVDGAHVYLVYFVPGTNPPVPIAYHVPNPDDLTAILGPGRQPTFTRDISRAELRSQGALVGGTTRSLRNLSENPFEEFLRTFNREAEIRPWLRDPEILAVTAKAILEGRQVTEAELKTTDWWRTRSEQQRQWIGLVSSDPESARRRVEDNRVRVREMLLAAGYGTADPSFVAGLADRWTQGDLTDIDLTEEVRTAAEPRALQGKDRVRQMVRRWVGPALAQRWDEAEIQRWGVQILRDPNAEEHLLSTLKRQRQAFLPEWTDPEIAYEDIAPIYRQASMQSWGQQLDETDPFFLSLMRTNDLSRAEQLLRMEGAKRGVAAVVDREKRDFQKAFGGAVREVAR